MRAKRLAARFVVKVGGLPLGPCAAIPGKSRLGVRADDWWRWGWESIVVRVLCGGEFVTKPGGMVCHREADLAGAEVPSSARQPCEDPLVL